MQPKNGISCFCKPVVSRARLRVCQAPGHDMMRSSTRDTALDSSVEHSCGVPADMPDDVPAHCLSATTQVKDKASAAINEQQILASAETCSTMSARCHCTIARIILVPPSGPTVTRGDDSMAEKQNQTKNSQNQHWSQVTEWGRVSFFLLFLALSLSRHCFSRPDRSCARLSGERDLRAARRLWAGGDSEVSWCVDTEASDSTEDDALSSTASS